MKRRLNENQSLEFMKQLSLGRLGCILESGEPYVVPVYYLFKGENIYIHSMPGQKISAMENNPRVCLQADMVENGGLEWESVIAFGEFEKVKDKEIKAAVMKEFYKRFPKFTPVEAVSDHQNSFEQLVVFRLKITRTSGIMETFAGSEVR